ncbi:MAG: CapA family protein [Clostridiales bacterium]|nr:CapA family protein [Clostridiales bacterium]
MHRFSRALALVLVLMLLGGCSAVEHILEGTAASPGSTADYAYQTSQSSDTRRDELAARSTTTARPSVMEITEEMAKAFQNGEVDVEDADLPPVILRLCAFGDVMAHGDTLNAAKISGGYDFNYMVAELSDYTKDADLVIANLETTLAGADRGYTGYPDFNTPEQIADALVEHLGLGLMSTANNHSLDRGFSGLCTTLDNLDARGIAHVGTNRTEEDSTKPLVLTVGGVRIGFINYTYGLNNPDNIKYKWSVNTIDKTKIQKMAKACTDAGAQYVIALMHWGEEYSRTLSSGQTSLAKWIFANTDVRLIIGTHPHVVQPIEEIEVEYNGKKKTGVVLYSLGNFTGSQIKKYTDTGILAEITLTLDLNDPDLSRVDTITCTSLFIDPNYGREKSFRVIAIERGTAAYTAGTDPLISSADYNKMLAYLSDYRSMLEKLPYVTVR